MHVTCCQSKLRKGLAIAFHAISSRSTLPVLSNVLLTAKDDTLTLASTNLELGLVCTVEASIIEEGALTIPAKLFSEFIASLPEDGVTLKTTKETMTITSGRQHATIHGMSADEFPSIPLDQHGTPVILPAAIFKAMSEDVVIAASKDDARPVFTGVLAEITENTLTLAAADSFRLAVHSCALPADGHPCGSYLIPATTLSELGKLLTTTDGDVALYVTEKKTQLLFQTMHASLVTRLIDGQFPNYRQLFPKEIVTTATLDRAAFLSATKAAALFARESSNILRLSIAMDNAEETGISGDTKPVDGLLTLEASAEDVGQSTSTVPLTFDGPPITIIFNVSYLMEVLSILHEEQVQLQFTTNQATALLRPVGNEDYTYLIMPMHNVR